MRLTTVERCCGYCTLLLLTSIHDNENDRVFTLRKNDATINKYLLTMSQGLTVLLQQKERNLD